MFVGDLQLQPVNGNPVLYFKTSLKKDSCTNQGVQHLLIFGDSVIYDELTINERQKSDEDFATILDCVRCGHPTDETIATLQQQVIDIFIAGKFTELQKLGQVPVSVSNTTNVQNIQQ